MEKIKFVMTDTDTQVSAVCRRALEAKGIAVTVCEKNGTKALETLLAVHPQAVLLDAFMPDLDAITVKQRYEAQNTSSTHTTFFVTGAFQSEEMELPSRCYVTFCRGAQGWNCEVVQGVGKMEKKSTPNGLTVQAL